MFSFQWQWPYHECTYYTACLDPKNYERMSGVGRVKSKRTSEKYSMLHFLYNFAISKRLIMIFGFFKSIMFFRSTTYIVRVKEIEANANFCLKFLKLRLDLIFPTHGHNFFNKYCYCCNQKNLSKEKYIL